MRTHHQIALLGLMLVGAAASLFAEPAQVSASRQNAAPIPFDQIGAAAGKQYSGDGLAAVATNDGGLLRCVFQRMNARATPGGLWITSTADGAVGEPFRVMAVAVDRETDTGAGDPFTPFLVLGEEEAARRAGEAMFLRSFHPLGRWKWGTTWRGSSGQA